MLARTKNAKNFMERHLCADCVVIPPPEIRTSYRQLVYERVCVHIKQLFNMDIA
jgi:hypothetical protein